MDGSLNAAVRLSAKEPAAVDSFLEGGATVDESGMVRGVDR